MTKQLRSSQHMSKLKIPPTQPGHWATSGIKIRTISFLLPTHHPVDPRRDGTRNRWRAITTPAPSRLASALAEGGFSSRAGISPPKCLSPRSCDARPDQGQTHADQPKTNLSSKLAGQRMVHTSARRAPAGSGSPCADQRPQRPAKRRRSQATQSTPRRAVLGGCLAAMDCWAIESHNCEHSRRADRGTCARRIP